MNWDIVGTVMASLGGASVIVAAFAHFLGKVWADRIAKQTTAKYNQEIEIIKSKNSIALEEFKRKSEAELKDREQFSGISKEVYQDFFKNRVSTYLKLLELKNSYISDMHEDFVTEETERWGDAYYSSYVSLRKLMIERQLYLSNELERAFSELRMKASQYTKEADMAEGYAIGGGANAMEADEERSPVHDKLAANTNELMKKVMDQIETDVSKLRSRIEIDKA